MPQSVSEIIRGRRTIHQFRPGEQVPVETMHAAIAHAVWAPNHHLTEPWRFYLLGPETVERVCRLNADLVRAVKGDRAAEIKLQRWREIPGWLLLTCVAAGDEVRRREDFAACCCAAQNLMLYLWNEGIGVKWTTGPVTADPRFFEITAIDPQRETIVGLFWYGYPEDVPAALRKPPAEITLIRP
jgi:nitroreductase